VRKVNGTRESGNGWNRLWILFKSCAHCVLPWEFSDVLKVYKLSKQDNQSKKLIKLGIENVVTYPHLFIQYKQHMVKSIMLLDYYHNVHEGWYEYW
jgi:hypothetical protein